jgi:hypothetical protein
VLKRERGSDKSRILYKGHDLRPGEEVLWLSNRKAEHIISYGQFVVTNERLMFEPLRMIGSHGRRWEVDRADVNDVELIPPPKRPWRTRGKLRLSFRDGKTTEFMFAPDGWFPSAADGQVALQEAYDQIKDVLRRS